MNIKTSSTELKSQIIGQGKGSSFELLLATQLQLAARELRDACIKTHDDLYCAKHMCESLFESFTVADVVLVANSLREQHEREIQETKDQQLREHERFLEEFGDQE